MEHLQGNSSHLSPIFVQDPLHLHTTCRLTLFKYIFQIQDTFETQSNAQQANIFFSLCLWSLAPVTHKKRRNIITIGEKV